MTTADRCAEIVRVYDGQGWHRTGTVVDNESASWLVEAMRASGVSAELQPFPFIRVDLDPCRVWSGPWEVAGQPLPDGLLPHPGTMLTGTVAEAPNPESFALVRVDQHGQSSILDWLRLEPWKAIIAVVEGTDTGLTVRNAWHYDNPGGPPIVQVPASSWDHLNQLKADRATVNIACGGRRTEVEASNVIGRVPGRDPNLPPIVVLTPRSGWWHCAGERGGGIAAWLEIARDLRTNGLHREVVFLATTGHELGFLGIGRYLERDPELARRALLWIHLGANIGARESPTVVRSAEQSLLDAILGLDDSAQDQAVRPECEVRPQPPGGEAQVVAAAGGRYVSIVGRGFPLFHSTEDRWPGAINAEAIANNANLLSKLIQRLDSGDVSSSAR